MDSLPPPPSYRRIPLRIACVQFDPRLGKVSENAAKVQSMTASLSPGQVDLLVLPEMALSGYMFKSLSEIRPYLERPVVGATAVLASSLAKRLECHVVAGYPEAHESDPLAATGEEARGYNSAVLASPSGVIGNYRKTFLFETDKNWALEGNGFTHFDLPQPLGRVAIGICMDLNPKEFLAPWDAFELARYCQKEGVDVLVMPMNWLDPGEQDTSDSDSDSDIPRNDPQAPSESNLNYWAARLTPLHDPSPSYGPEIQHKELVFVACNRTGVEADTRFVGTSAVMTCRSAPSGIELIECCNRSEERVMVCQVT